MSMIDKNAQLSGARNTLRFNVTAKTGEISVVEYKASPLTDRDISELNIWLQEHTIRIAQGSLHPGLSQKERDEVLDAAIRSSASISVQSVRGAAILATVDGWSRLVWQMIHRDHPDVTVETLRAQMYDPGNVDEASRVFNKQNVQGSKRPDPQGGRRKRR